MKTNRIIPLIAILRGITPVEVIDHAEALHDSGFSTVEIPINSPDWLESIRRLIKQMSSKMRIAAGTVTEKEQILDLAQAGCQFILTPNIDISVLIAAKKADMTVYAGCQTVSEAFNAIHHGVTDLKLFPASHLGVNYVSALKAVLPTDITLYAVGGINKNNLPAFIQAGCHGAGLGSELYRAGQTPEQTTKNAIAFMQVWKSRYQ